VRRPLGDRPAPTRAGFSSLMMEPAPTTELEDLNDSDRAGDRPSASLDRHSSAGGAPTAQPAGVVDSGEPSAAAFVVPAPLIILPEVFVAAFFALLTAYLVFAFSSTGTLGFPDRSIGIGIVSGVDPSRRTRIYVVMIGLSLLVSLGCHYGFQALRRKVPSWFRGVRSSLENDLCATFCALGSVALVTRVAADRLNGLTCLNLSLAGFASVSCIALARRLWSRQKHGPLLRQLTAWSTIATLSLLLWPSVQMAALGQALMGKSGSWSVLSWSMSLPVAYVIALLCSLRWRGQRTRAHVRQAIVLATAPFFLLPIVCPIANEIQYALLAYRPMAPSAIALAFLVLLVLASALLFSRALRGGLWISPRRLLARFCFPTVVFGATLTTFHPHQLAAKMFDALHDGEQITSVYQLLQFGKWPFVDVWPAHGLFDYAGILYAKVNGFRPFELTAWNGILAACSAIAVYAILANVSTPLFAFLVAMLLPIEAIFPLPVYSYFFAEPALLGVGLLMCWTLGRPTRARYIILSVSTYLCFFWTPASGVVCIAAVFALLLLDCVTRSDRSLARRGLGLFVATGAAVFIAYSAVLLACHRPVFETLGLVRAFIRADPMIGGRAFIIDQFDTIAFFQYVALPGVGLIYLIGLARHAIERRPLGRVDLLLGFLALASFALFVRTLSRHSLYERYQPFFFPFLALAAFMPRDARDRDARSATAEASSATRFARAALARAWFCGGLALYLVVFPVQSQARAGLPALTFHEWRLGESRYLGQGPDYPKLKAFLDATLRPSDTFFELLNMPLLYTLFEREFPGQFFFAAMFYASDEVQNTFLKRFDEFGGSDRVPVVLLDCAACPAHIDGIPNTLRSYRVAERIFRDYVPFTRIDGFEVWVSRKRWDEAGRAVNPLPLPFAEPAAYQAHSLQAMRLGDDALRLTANGAAPQLRDAVKVDGVQLGGLASYHGLRFQYRTNVPGTLELRFRYGSGDYDAANSGRLTVRPNATGAWQSGQVSLPNQAEENLSLAGLAIDPPDGAEFEIRSLELVFGQPAARSSEAYSLGMLPFIWGNFDARLGHGEGAVLERIAVPRPSAKPRPIQLALRQPPDTSAGNYLQLCLKLPHVNVPSGAAPRRWQTVKHGDDWQSVGKVKLSYGSNPVSTFDFDLVQPNPLSPRLSSALADSFDRECKRYIIRLSSQYAWSSQRLSVISLETSLRVVLVSAELLAGD
jgi:hypothetical protein